MNEVKVVQPGTVVHVGRHGNIPARVEAVSIRGPKYHLSYEVSFWNEEGEFVVQWVSEFEVKLSDSNEFTVKLKMQ